MAHVALTTISSKGQHVLRVKVLPLFPSYASGCLHSFLPCRVAFLPTEGSSAWWQHGSSRTGMDQSCHRIRERRSRGDPGHWVFREIQPVQATGDPPAEVTHCTAYCHREKLAEMLTQSHRTPLC